MKRFGMDYFIAAAMCAIIIFAMSSSAAAGIIYVKWNSPGSGDPPVYDGKSWDTAFHAVWQGLAAATAGDDVWVAGNKDHPYVIRITLKKGVGLYGGFAGTEASRDQRNWNANVTILDGDGGGTVVVSGDAATATTVIDGFTIRNGGNSGIGCMNSSPTISNNTIIGNGTLENDGGIYCLYASPLITNNTITGNTAYDGGGICSSYSSPTISNNTIRGNTAVDGGGIYVGGSLPTMVFNNTISGNRARRGGGIMCSGSAIIANNTITGNDSWYSGGGVHCQSGTSVISNNVVAFNSSGIFKVSGSPALANNCVYNPGGYDYSGLSAGIGDISTDPKLVGVGYGQLHIQPDSPCRDAGDDSAVQPGAVDMDGQARIQGLRVDIGADESDGTVWTSTPLIVRVSPTGNDANDGSSWALAQRSVQAGANAASLSGGEVWVAAGTYGERIALPAYVYLYGGFAGSEISKLERSWRANVTVLDGGGGGPVITSSEPGFRLACADGFTLRNGSAHAGGGVYCAQSSPAISNNAISANNARDGGGVYCSYSRALITLNTISGNVGTYAGGISCDSYSSSTIWGNAVTGNSGYGIRCGLASAAKISNNTIAGNSSTGLYCSASSPEVVNTIVAFNSYGVTTTGKVDMPTLRNSNVFGNVNGNYKGFPTDPTGTNGNISLDPLFRNAPSGDYHLLWNSPCVDTGTNIGAPSTDLDGNPRPIDGNMDGLAVTDIGAYEYVPIRVVVDVLPGDSTNIIQLQPNRMITVAILGTPEFDARSINPVSVLFGPGAAVEAHGRGHWEDVNGDGRIDLALHFRCERTGIQPGDTTVSLFGRLASGAPFTGSDTIVAIGSKSKAR